MTTIEIPGKPVPKGRPRFMNQRPVTPKETRAFETHVAQCCLAAKLKLEPGKPYSVEMDFYDDHTVVRIYDGLGKARRADLDNLVKSVLDGIGKYGELDGWNDRQVTRLVGRYR